MTKTSILLTIGSIVWVSIFMVVIYILREVVRIDKRLMKTSSPEIHTETQDNKTRMKWIAAVIFVVCIPILIALAVKGGEFAKTFFIVAFGLLPSVAASTTLLFFLPNGMSVPIAAVVLYGMLAFFLGDMALKVKQSTFIAVFASFIAVLLIGYGISFFMTLKFLAGS